MVKINRVLLVGAKQVGKTAILEQLIYGHVTKDSVNLLVCTEMVTFDSLGSYPLVYLAPVSRSSTPRLKIPMRPTLTQTEV